MRVASQVRTDSPVEGDGFEPSVPRVMDGDLGGQVPALIAVFVCEPISPAGGNRTAEEDQLARQV